MIHFSSITFDTVVFMVERHRLFHIIGSDCYRIYHTELLRDRISQTDIYFAYYKKYTGIHLDVVEI